jgi:NADPH:quinone reductase-like Zn-dependent oxidoreductase
MEVCTAVIRKTKRMKKIIYNRYGNAEVLEVAETEIPTIHDNDILVKAKAVSINPLDWKLFKGEMKMMSGSKFPKGVGIDFSGIIEKVGTNISKLKKGDEVFGLTDLFKGGALAEYIVVSEKDIAIKPRNISFEQAAALPVVGSSALQILDKLVSIKNGTKILINGATGGIGMLFTQLASKSGATVTAVASLKGSELAKKWGADETIDYKTKNILSIHKKFDVVIDLSGKLTFKKAKPLLKSQAVFVNTIPSLKAIIGAFINNIFSRKKYKVLILKPTAGYLKSLALLTEEGLDIIVDRSYPLTSVKEAYSEVARGGILGKAVIVI